MAATTGDILTENGPSSKLHIRRCPLPSCLNDPVHKTTDRSLSNHYISMEHQRRIALQLRMLNEKPSHSNCDTEEQCDDSANDSKTEDTQLPLMIARIEGIGERLVEIETLSNRLHNREQSMQDGLKRISGQAKAQERHLAALTINGKTVMFSVNSLKDQVEATESFGNQSTGDGTAIWKITGVQEKILDAQSERATSIYSPDFFSSPTGYRFRIRLYLNGDGTARGTHLSIFLVILRGPYDNLLQWPFEYRVAFCLVDQRALLEPDKNEESKDIIDCFRADSKSVSFQKPSSEMNIASGIAKFAPLEVLEESMARNRYRINDTMYIKAYIGFVGLPKSILPFIFGLNPGLPSMIRETLIAKELERIEQAKKAIDAGQKT